MNKNEDKRWESWSTTHVEAFYVDAHACVTRLSKLVSHLSEFDKGRLVGLLETGLWMPAVFAKFWVHRNTATKWWDSFWTICRYMVKRKEKKLRSSKLTLRVQERWLCRGTLVCRVTDLHLSLFYYLTGNEMYCKPHKSGEHPSGEQKWSCLPAVQPKGRGQKVKGRRRVGDGPDSQCKKEMFCSVDIVCLSVLHLSLESITKWATPCGIHTASAERRKELFSVDLVSLLVAHLFGNRNHQSIAN